MYFLVNLSPPYLLQTLQVHRLYDVEVTGQHFLWP